MALKTYLELPLNTGMKTMHIEEAALVLSLSQIAKLVGTDHLVRITLESSDESGRRSASASCATVRPSRPGR